MVQSYNSFGKRDLRLVHILMSAAPPLVMTAIWALGTQLAFTTDFKSCSHVICDLFFKFFHWRNWICLIAI